MTEFGQDYSFTTGAARRAAEEILRRYPKTLFIKSGQVCGDSTDAGHFLKQYLVHERDWATIWNPGCNSLTYKLTVDESEEDEFLETMKELASDEFLVERCHRKVWRNRIHKLGGENA